MYSVTRRVRARKLLKIKNGGEGGFGLRLDVEVLQLVDYTKLQKLPKATITGFVVHVSYMDSGLVETDSRLSVMYRGKVTCFHRSILEKRDLGIFSPPQ
jgi:hypothetical protein